MTPTRPNPVGTCADPYALPVLTATVGTLCKRWQRLPDGTLHGTPYGQAYFHTLQAHPVLPPAAVAARAQAPRLFPGFPTPTAGDLAATLASIARNRGSCVIRGTPRPALAEALDRCPRFPVRRTLDNFEDTPRAWALIDIDTPPPAGAPPPDVDPEGYAAAVRASLPGLPGGPLQATACAFLLSSSCGLKRNKAGVHFWYLLDAPLPSGVLRAWAPSVGADPSLFHPVQVHYTAPPQFHRMADPLPRRIGVLPGVPYLPTAPIRATGARILAVEREREAMAARARESACALLGLNGRGGGGGDVEHATCEQVAEAFGIVTDTGDAGELLCDCPRHNSDSRRSLRVDPSGDRWYCFGCQKGGGAWALAAWCLGDDAATEGAIIHALRAARQGEKVSNL